MDNKTYSVTLSDGTVIENLTMNGNNFVSKKELTPDIFVDNCSTVIVSDGIESKTYDNMEFVQLTMSPDATEYWFILRELSAAEMAQIKLQSDLEYIAMMTGVEL